MKTREKIALALAIGAASGAAAGVLFAPHKGAKTRRIIKQEGKKMVDGITGTFDKGKKNVSDLKQQVIHTIKGSACRTAKEEAEVQDN